MKFKDLALGARFKYFDSSSKGIWIKLDDENYGLIAEYDVEGINQGKWIGQKVCSFADTLEQMDSLEVVLHECALR